MPDWKKNPIGHAILGKNIRHTFYFFSIFESGVRHRLYTNSLEFHERDMGQTKCQGLWNFPDRGGGRGGHLFFSVDCERFSKVEEGIAK